MGLIETGMAWFWSDERVKKWFDVEGFANLNHALSGGKGVMVVGVHFMSLELGGRAMGLCRPMMATYRPHNSPLMEWVQTRGRLRSNKAMIDRNNLTGLVPVSYTHLRAHETRHDLVCRLLLEKKKKTD